MRELNRGEKKSSGLRYIPIQDKSNFVLPSVQKCFCEYHNCQIHMELFCINFVLIIRLYLKLIWFGLFAVSFWSRSKWRLLPNWESSHAHLISISIIIFVYFCATDWENQKYPHFIFYMHANNINDMKPKRVIWYQAR